MMPLHLIFWFLLAGICYTYLFYGLILWLLAKKRKPNLMFKKDESLPAVAHIIAAYNEEAIIEQKIQNTLSLDYPFSKIKTIIVADGSTDATVSKVSQYSAITVLYVPERSGKLAAINRAVQYVGETDILVFSDANTMLNKSSIKKIVAHYVDPMVGGVAAEKKVISSAKGMIRGEGLYWKYESFLKKCEDRYYSVLGAAGELFSLRYALFKPLDESIILDDLMISLHVCRQGRVIRYESDAYAVEMPSLTIKDEWIRKTRISAGAFQAIQCTTDLLNPFTNKKIAFQYFSHRIMRWVFCPLAIPLLFILNVMLLWYDQHPLYTILFTLQAIFYLLALMGSLFAVSNKPVSNLFYIPFYMLFMQLAQWKGFVTHLKGNQSVIWEKARRLYVS